MSEIQGIPRGGDASFGQKIRLHSVSIDRDGLGEIRVDILSPDCRDGKCAACIGDAWDDVKDQGSDCQHACHGGSAAA